MQARRVVITGMGVCAPNAIGIEEFDRALTLGISGIRFQKELESLNFGCQIAGTPQVSQDLIDRHFSRLEQKGLEASGLIYGVIAAEEAWKDAAIESSEDHPLWDTGIVFGTGISGVDKFREAIYRVDEGRVRRLGSTVVTQTMASGISATLAGRFGCGNQVTTNSSACITGTEALLMGAERIRSGKADKMLVGSTSDSGPYVWGGFDAMRILPRNFNQDPEQGSRPMSSNAAGFVPGSGAGALVLESLESALNRNAKIYAELLGGHVNNGGHRQGGSMTAPNSQAVQRCIREALADAKIKAFEISSINGHLTATAKDPVEIENWKEALGYDRHSFPFINSFKSTLGHCLAAAGSLECIGAVLQIFHGKIYRNRNIEPMHPAILDLIESKKVNQETLSIKPKIVAKASFGFGDVNACAIFKQYNS